jgi:23S rRNA (adenine2503-C2)-methyltransferase
MIKTPEIRNLSLQELEQYFTDIGQKSFRAKQVFKWLYQRDAQSFAEMTDVALPVRERLAEDFVFTQLRVVHHLVSRDGTEKFLFKLADGECLETAVIPTEKRATVCASSQVGCKFQCRFCASGMKGWRRDLSCAEMLAQILFVKKHIQPRSLTNIVFMGIGEPLDNYDELLKAIRIINSSEGIGVAARRITISTCGLIPQIRRLMGEKLQIELAISLHGYDNASRQALMPISKKYPFTELITVCREYVRNTKRQITFEYVLIKDFTCTPQAVAALGRNLKGFDCKINLIPYNEITDFSFKSPTTADVESFKEALIKGGIHTIIRLPRGRDISAACGQLRGASGNSP